jgi:hypothetical protein
MAVNDNGGFDIAELERAAFVHFKAGFDGLSFPDHEYWPPGPPGRAYMFEMIRREFGWAGFEYAKTLPIFTSH